MPILLSPKDSMNSNISEFIKSKNIPVSYIVGGSDVVGTSVASDLPNYERLGGDNRYATNLIINQTFEEDLDFSTIYLATGSNFPDALAGSALAAKNNAPIFLTGRGSLSAETINFLKTKNVSNIVAFGGSDVVSENIVNNTIEGLTVKGYVDNNELDIDLKVRSAPNADATILGKLYNFEKIKILETVDDNMANATPWYKINYTNSAGFVSVAYIQHYTSPPDAVVAIARNISKQFEVGKLEQIAGNDDGQGLSLGYLQWNIRQNALQPLLNRMDRQYPSEMKTIFGTNYDIIHEVITDYSLDEQLVWARSINNASDEIIEPWKSQFNILCNNKNFISIEEDAEVQIVKRAMIICKDYELKTIRGFALAFDIVLQNGSIIPDATKNIDTARAQNLNMNEKALLRVIANAVADSSYTDNSEDVRSRKLAIVNGQGSVHDEMLYLDENYKLSDNYWNK